MNLGSAGSRRLRTTALDLITFPKSFIRVLLKMVTTTTRTNLRDRQTENPLCVAIRKIPEETDPMRIWHPTTDQNLTTISNLPNRSSDPNHSTRIWNHMAALDPNLMTWIRKNTISVRILLIWIQPNHPDVRSGIIRFLSCLLKISLERWNHPKVSLDNRGVAFLLDPQIPFLLIGLMRGDLIQYVFQVKILRRRRDNCRRLVLDGEVPSVQLRHWARSRPWRRRRHQRHPRLLQRPRHPTTSYEKSLRP